MRDVTICVVLLAATSFAGCSSSLTDGASGDDTGGSNTGSNAGSDDIPQGSGSGSGSGDQYDQILGSRTVDYGAALRIAALRLTGDLPTVVETHSVTATDAAANKTAYNALITSYLSRPTFATQMVNFWRDTFKQGGTPLLDTAPVFAAELSVTNGSYMDLFQAGSGNCPTFSGAGSGTFTPAECGNGGPVAGVLTNPGVQAQFFSNFAFRRVRWIQEMFVCTAFPAEVSATTQNVGGVSPYTGVWPFKSISSPTNGGGRIDFEDTQAIICANCHTTINHIAPLFAYYDVNGKYQPAISVPTPLTNAPPAMLTDYLPAGEVTAWRFGEPTADIPALGKAMAADPDVAECGVARMWNWALGKADIVDALELVPSDTIADETAAFTTSGFKIKDLIYAVFTSDDFVKF